MIYDTDPWLEPYKQAIDARHKRIEETNSYIKGSNRRIYDSVNNHLYYGLHKEDVCWAFREWAPNANRIYVIGDFNNWRKSPEYEMKPIGGGNWELLLPLDEVHHGDKFKWFVEWPGGAGERLPAYAFRCVQDPETKVFCAEVWSPAKPYRWRHRKHISHKNPLIYEVHIGMSSEDEKVSTFEEFRLNVLPRIIKLGYNTIQIMALQEHPYYGSFGYQVSNFYALSSRFGTPDEFKKLVDEAHGHNISVIMDLVHSHAVKNEVEGLSRLDGSLTTYFHDGPKGEHPAWNSRCFDYGKNETRYFLLSNCKFWMEEYRLDGFRFDGVTSMLYFDHGLGRDFCSYDSYFNGGVDEDAVIYLGLANILIHEVYHGAITIAEDMSGMAGLAAPLANGGIGFGYRMSMGVPDMWIKWIKERSDWDWNMHELWHELTNKRDDEKTISYAECHDQALVGDKTIIFRLIDKEMYYHMDKNSSNILIDRGIALHKMIRLVTLATAGNGYLNFMGNEFGHPEWIDFPREGNGWSYKYARRQWHLADDDNLRYKGLSDFDAAMIHLFVKERLLAMPHFCYLASDNDKTLCFTRGDFMFAFNFNPDRSFTDYWIEAPAGTWSVVFSSDRPEFGGFGRIDENMEYMTNHSSGKDYLRLYLPARTVTVLRLHRKPQRPISSENHESHEAEQSPQE